MKLESILRAGTFALLGFWLAQTTPAGAQRATTPISASTIPAAQLIQPQQLSQLLRAPAAQRPLILQVGSRVMYNEAHIPGSQYAGPAALPQGLDLLRSSVHSLAHDRFLVLYCGCCPWSHCPNVGPAYKLLHEMGFTRVKVLYIADNFGADWVNKGLPVDHGR
jgi:thiosulfate/3-mercaptopyruvate sulfurtransferase